MESSWPLAQWGIDLLSTFPPAKGLKKFLIIAIEYFTKWVEVEPIGLIMKQVIISFRKKHIISQFEIPKNLILDNGTQFAGSKMRDFCQAFEITQHFTLVAHAQANGQMEFTN